MMNDEIDVFHKQRDVVPLDHPVFDLKNEDKDNDKDDEDNDEDRGSVAKILLQSRYVQSKTVDVEDDDDSEEEKHEHTFWGKNPGTYYNADTTNLEGDLTDEDALDIEEEALKMHKDKLKALSISIGDFGLHDIIENESNEEPTFEESLRSGKPTPKTFEGQQLNKDENAIYEKLKKDLTALTREEQMDVVYSSAPEIVGLLSELNNALEQRENKVDPLLCKVIEGKDGMRGGMHYLELRKLLLLSYCQAITFYLLLKSEGLSARDHPVIAQLLQMKTLMDKCYLVSHLPAKNVSLKIFSLTLT
ncbi:RNA metabolism protein [Lithospermum erythrorhizon]|uniref:RNA metabolism protein n=1 Tax=Lithospermum erythrorhizon TaxID=34254 RepID=A0AAV3S0B4_LITER